MIYAKTRANSCALIVDLLEMRADRRAPGCICARDYYYLRMILFYDNVVGCILWHMILIYAKLNKMLIRRNAMPYRVVCNTRIGYCRFASGKASTLQRGCAYSVWTALTLHCEITFDHPPILLPHLCIEKKQMVPFVERLARWLTSLFVV